MVGNEEKKVIHWGVRSSKKLSKAFGYMVVKFKIKELVEHKEVQQILATASDKMPTQKQLQDSRN